MSHPDKATELKGLNSVSSSERADPEVVPQAKRRQFSAAYKLRILQEADGCSAPGQMGALLRREGLYSSHLTEWRRLRQQGELTALAPQRRGRQRSETEAQASELAHLRQENARLQRRLEQTELVIDVQKKLSQLLGLSVSDSQKGERR